MGNPFRAHIIICLIVVFACFAVTACTVAQPTLDVFLPQAQQEPTVEPAPDAIGGRSGTSENLLETDPRYMDVQIRCEDVRRDACGLLVTLNAIYDDIELDILLHNDNGIRFLPNMDVLPQDISESQIGRIKLHQGESRQILFPYLPSDLDLPGAYQVIVLAAEADTNNLFAYRRTNAFVIFNEIGEFHLLPSEFEFNSNFRNRFTDGLLNMAYWIQFEGDERPHRGNLWLRVDSLVDGYQPRIEITGGDAVTFLDDGLWNPEVSNSGMTASRTFPIMNAGGSRVAVFPFELDRNGRLLDGKYTFRVQQTESGFTNTEIMPVVVQLFSDPQYPNEHWLGAHPISPEIATATPNATAVAIDENNIRAGNVGFGGMYKDLDENTADGVCLGLVKYPLPTDDLPEPRWTRRIANYNGTLCQAYLDFVAGSVAITWPDFEEDVVKRNPNIDSSSDRFEDHRVYLLPMTD